MLQSIRETANGKQQIDMTFTSEKWYDLYRLAMTELQHSSMAGRIMDARAEVMKRIEKLQELPGLNRDESQALQDALNGLQMLDRSEAEYAAEQQRAIARAALDNLHSIESKVMRLKSEQSQDHAS